MAPLASAEEGNELKQMGNSRDLTLAYSKSNIHIFLPNKEVKVV